MVTAGNQRGHHPGGYHGGNGVCRVVEPVREIEGKGDQYYRDQEGQ